MSSEYCTVPFCPGHCAAVLAGTWDSDCGKVTGRCPDGFALPNSRAPMAGPSCWPRYQASSTPAPEPSHGMGTPEPVVSTTMGCGLAAATAETTEVSARDRVSQGRPLPP